VIELEDAEVDIFVGLPGHVTARRGRGTGKLEKAIRQFEFLTFHFHARGKQKKFLNSCNFYSNLTRRLPQKSQKLS
jgi:hypothetical protein